MSAKPLIGIQVRKPADQNEYRLNYKYPEAIYAGGGIPIMLPLIPTRDYLEAVQNENLDEHYIFGVQWHPERTWEVDEFSLSIF